MNRLVLVAGALALVGTANAQARSSDDDLAAWYGIMITPVGAFPSIESPAGQAGGSSQLAIRVSTWNPAGASGRQNSYGLSYLPAATSSIRYGLTIGWLQPSDAPTNDGTIMVGGDVGSAVWQSARIANGGSAFSLDWKLSGGLGHSRAEGGIEYWSVVGQVPIKWAYQMASRSTISAYASPGYGVAGVGDAADAENGMRSMISFGGAWTTGGFGLHFGAQRVLLDSDIIGSPPWVMGLSVSFSLGGKQAPSP